jgi:hypothetical protein
MPHAWLVFVLVFVSIFAFAKLFGPARHSDHDTRYRYKRTPLFNGTEHRFLIELRSLAPPHIAVLAKVRVADVILPITDKNFAAFNRIARKHVDFVLYNTQSRKVVRAIELDGPAHASARARRSDEMKNRCFASAGVLLTRIDATHWNASTLRALFSDERTVGGATSPSGINKGEAIAGFAQPTGTIERVDGPSNDPYPRN